MRSKRLAVVLDLAERDKDEAARLFELAQTQFAEEQEKLAQLSDYYREYQQAFAAVSGLRATDLMKQRNFLQQLSQARQQQQAVINAAGKVVEQTRAAWQNAHLKHKNMADLLLRYKLEEQAALGKKEQKMLDEWSQSRYSR